MHLVKGLKSPKMRTLWGLRIKMLLVGILIGAGIPVLGFMNGDIPAWLGISWLIVLSVWLIGMLLRSFDIFSPLILFSGVYVLYYILGAYPNPVTGWYLSPVSLKVACYGLLGLICFVTGTISSRLVVGGRLLWFNEFLYSHLKTSIQRLPRARVQYVALAYACVGLLFAAGLFYMSGGIPLLSSGGLRNLVRYDLVKRGGFSLFFQLYFLYVAATVSSAVAFQKRVLRPLAVVLVGLSGILFLSIFYRVEIVRILFSLALIYHYVHRRISSRALIFLAICAMFAVGGVHMLRVGSLSKDWFTNMKLTFWYFQGSVGFPLRVFEYVLEAIPSQMGFFRGQFNFSTYLALFGQFPSGPELIRRYLFPDRYTAQTLALPGGWYADGGIWAVVLGMTFSGFIMQTAYALFIKNGGVMWLLIYMNVAFEMLYSIYLGGGALGVRLWFLILLTVGAYQFCDGRSTQTSWLIRLFVILAIITGLIKFASLL